MNEYLPIIIKIFFHTENQFSFYTGKTFCPHKKAKKVLRVGKNNSKTDCHLMNFRDLYGTFHKYTKSVTVNISYCSEKCELFLRLVRSVQYFCKSYILFVISQISSTITNFLKHTILKQIIFNLKHIYILLSLSTQVKIIQNHLMHASISDINPNTKSRCL